MGPAVKATKTTDTRAKKFVGTSVELDAIPASKLRELVRGSDPLIPLPACHDCQIF